MPIKFSQLDGLPYFLKYGGSAWALRELELPYNSPYAYLRQNSKFHHQASLSKCGPVNFKKNEFPMHRNTKNNLVKTTIRWQRFIMHKTHCRSVGGSKCVFWSKPVGLKHAQLCPSFFQHLPKGAVFVNTAKGSIIATFRLSTVEAAKKLWEMYTEGEFQAKLQKVLVDDTLKEQKKVPDKPVKLNLSIGEDRFNQIQKKLAGN